MEELEEELPTLAKGNNTTQILLLTDALVTLADYLSRTIMKMEKIIATYRNL
jgi:hypothetical protein